LGGPALFVLYKYELQESEFHELRRIARNGIKPWYMVHPKTSQ